MSKARRTSVIALVFVIVQLGSSPILAQVPDSLSFQGVLTDTSGVNVPDGSYNLLFKMYKNGTSLCINTIPCLIGCFVSRENIEF